MVYGLDSHAAEYTGESSDTLFGSHFERALQQRATRLNHLNSSFLAQEEDTRNAETTHACAYAVMVSNSCPMASSKASLLLVPALSLAVLSGDRTPLRWGRDRAHTQGSKRY